MRGANIENKLKTAKYFHPVLPAQPKNLLQRALFPCSAVYPGDVYCFTSRSKNRVDLLPLPFGKKCDKCSLGVKDLLHNGKHNSTLHESKIISYDVRFGVIIFFSPLQDETQRFTLLYLLCCCNCNGYHSLQPVPYSPKG